MGLGDNRHVPWTKRGFDMEVGVEGAGGVRIGRERVCVCGGGGYI